MKILPLVPVLATLAAAPVVVAAPTLPSLPITALGGDAYSVALPQGGTLNVTFPQAAPTGGASITLAPSATTSVTVGAVQHQLTVCTTGATSRCRAFPWPGALTVGGTTWNLGFGASGGRFCIQFAGQFHQTKCRSFTYRGGTAASITVAATKTGTGQGTWTANPGVYAWVTFVNGTQARVGVFPGNGQMTGCAWRADSSLWCTSWPMGTTAGAVSQLVASGS